MQYFEMQELPACGTNEHAAQIQGCPFVAEYKTKRDYLHMEVSGVQTIVLDVASTG
jgi:hypothetical protein